MASLITSTVVSVLLFIIGLVLLLFDSFLGVVAAVGGAGLTLMHLVMWLLIYRHYNRSN